MKTSLVFLCILVLSNALPRGEQEKIHCVDQEDCTELGIGAFCCQSTCCNAGQKCCDTGM
eukprot:12684.XXX_71943_71657_1 [CDS] Oithona nana genome sequencing.